MKDSCITSNKSQKLWTQFELWLQINTLRLRQNGHRFADDIFKLIFFNESFYILIQISLKHVPKSSIDNNLAMAQIMSWRQTGDSHYLNQCWPSSASS